MVADRITGRLMERLPLPEANGYLRDAHACTDIKQTNIKMKTRRRVLTALAVRTGPRGLVLLFWCLDVMKLHDVFQLDVAPVVGH